MVNNMDDLGCFMGSNILYSELVCTKCGEKYTNGDESVGDSFALAREGLEIPVIECKCGNHNFNMNAMVDILLYPTKEPEKVEEKTE